MPRAIQQSLVSGTLLLSLLSPRRETTAPVTLAELLTLFNYAWCRRDDRCVTTLATATRPLTLCPTGIQSGRKGTHCSWGSAHCIMFSTVVYTTHVHVHPKTIKISGTSPGSQHASHHASGQNDPNHAVHHQTQNDTPLCKHHAWTQLLTVSSTQPATTSLMQQKPLRSSGRASKKLTATRTQHCTRRSDAVLN